MKTLPPLEGLRHEEKDVLIQRWMPDTRTLNPSGTSLSMAHTHSFASLSSGILAFAFVQAASQLDYVSFRDAAFS